MGLTIYLRSIVVSGVTALVATLVFLEFSSEGPVETLLLLAYLVISLIVLLRNVIDYREGV